MDYNKVSEEFLKELNALNTMHGKTLSMIKTSDLSIAIKSAFKEYDRQKSEQV